MRNKYKKKETKQKRKTIVELSTPIFSVVRGLYERSKGAECGEVGVGWGACKGRSLVSV